MMTHDRPPDVRRRIYALMVLMKAADDRLT
jgi:hypothetical protein